jgi:hypothetical protein
MDNPEIIEQTADQQDAFLEGWDDASVSEVSADPQEEKPTNEGADKESEAAAEGKAAESAEDKPAEEAKPEAEAEAPAIAEEPSWDLKYMGEPRTMKASEVTPELLQKALDYDRVRGKYDEAKPVMDMFTQFAKQAGMSVSDYVAYIRRETKMNGGMSEEEARRAVELEDREAAVAAKEAAQKEEADAQTQAQAKVQADLAEFKRSFPEVFEKAKNDPKAIPEAVWAEVNSGRLSLTGAYSRWAVQQAQAAQKAAEAAAKTETKNSENAAKSTGSMKSAGADTASKDPFMEGWNSL